MDINKLVAQIKNGNFDEKFLDIYIDREKLEYQKNRYINAIQMYEMHYGKGNITVFSAPGRSEIGGNHTDHQHGEVLCASINYDAIGIVGKVSTKEIRIVSDKASELVVFCDDLEIKEAEKGTTKALVKGVLHGFIERGYQIGGFHAYITSDVLVGAGVSSSAAFETLIGSILSGLYNKMSVSSVEIAMIGQYAENVYFGKPCGLMDQMACSVGGLVHIDFRNPQKPIMEQVIFDLETYGYSLCITDTKGSHADLTDEYAAVPKEMKCVANYFGKEVLVDVSMEQLLSEMVEIRKVLSDRCVLRALHFLNENERVKKEVKALKENDIEKFLSIVQESGNSSFKYLQNVYTNKDIKQQNVSLALALSEMFLQEKGVCRVHGGGFAGTIQAFVKNENVKEYQKSMNKVFGKNACSIFKIRKYGGIQVV
ncbi:MAG: galactokinase [Lachnospiraceae bacterium]|nr:galactokinase [Lachnospiraceae bacterium]